MTTRHLATYFDGGYFARARVLHDSLVATGADFTLTALCLDDDALAAVRHLGADTFRPMALADLEAAHPELVAVKPTRSPAEYYFTLGPTFLHHLLDQDGVDSITYLDADMRFYADPEVLFDEAGDASTVIVGHRFPPRLRHLEETGRYNVAWVGFRDDADGRACLGWWRERCLEWCHDVVEPDRYADQKYLDAFPDGFAGVHVLRHPGADVAPWNLLDPPLGRVDGTYVVGGEPLVFFHFQGLKRLGPHLVDPNLAAYGTRADAAVRRLYTEYLAELEAVPTAVVASPRRREVARSPARRAAMVARGVLRRQLLVGSAVR
jgi:hypothetical protein